MHPRLFATPYFTLHTFGVFLAAAYGMALWWLVRAARRTGIDPEGAMGLGYGSLSAPWLVQKV